MGMYFGGLKRNRFLLYAVLSLLVTGQVSAQQSSEESQMQGRAADAQETNNKITILQLEALKELKQADVSLELLLRKLSADLNNHELWAYLGQNYSERSDFEKAAVAYSTAAANSKPPQSDIYTYYKAEAENRAGNTEGAKRSLNSISKDSPYRQSAENAIASLQSGQKLPEPQAVAAGKFKTDLGVDVGYDDNVLLFSENTLATAQRTDTASMYVTPKLNVSYSKLVKHGMFNANLNLNTQQYGNPNAKIYQSFAGSLSAGLSGQQPAWMNLTHSVTNTFKTSYLDSNSFSQQSWDDTVQWRGVKSLSESDSVTFGFSVRYQNYIQGTGADNRTGLAYKPEASFSSTIGEYGCTVGMSYERLQAEGDNYKSDSYSLPINLDRKINDSLDANLGFTYAYTQYPSSSASRKDGTASVNLGLNKKFSKVLSGGLDYSYTKNSSSESAGTYTRQTIGLKVNYEIN